MTQVVLFFANIKLEWLKITVSARSRDFSRNFNKLKELFMWYCPIKFEIGLKSILGFKSYDTYWMYFWRISNWSGCKYFQMRQVSSVKTFLLWLIFCFSSSKIILKLCYNQSWILKPMIHVDRALCKYQTREVADYSFQPISYLTKMAIF